MSRRIGTDHLLLLQPPAILDGHRMDCTNCGAQQQIDLPLPMDRYVALVDAFVKQHRRCVRPSHLEVLSPEQAVCHHCGLMRQAIQGARIDVAAFVATHKDCKARKP